MTKIILLYLFVMLGFFLFADYYITYVHEVSHQQIFVYYGLDSNKEIYFGKLGFSGRTVPIYNDSEISDANTRDMNLANALIDGVSYQFINIFSMVMLAIFITGAFLSILIIWKR